MKIAGLDIGTTSCKFTVFDESGRYIEKFYRDYPLNRGKSEHEVDAGAIREGVLDVIKEGACNYPDIAGIGVTSFGETFVLLDAEDRPLLPAMLYTDSRGKEECGELAEKIGTECIARISGINPSEMYSIPKLLWIKKNRPEVYQKAKRLFQMGDYIVYILTGERQIDYSLASRTMAFDIQTLSWSDKIIDAAGIDKALFSRPVPSGTPAGLISANIAEKTGLRKTTIVVSAAHDQVAAVVGSGVADNSEAVDGAGTVECITPVFDRIPADGSLYKGNYAIVPYITQGKYVCYAFSYTGGALLQWCIDNLAKDEKAQAEKLGKSAYTFLENEKNESPTGILVLPHFAGAATPYMDLGSKGAIVGLTLSSTVQDIFRACMEGVVYEMMLNTENLNEAGIRFTSLRATGGGASSRLWMQMKADALNIPIHALATSDAGTVGSAMLTGIALGCFSDIDSAAASMVHISESYYPQEKQHERYMRLYEKYRGLYRAIRPLV